MHKMSISVHAAAPKIPRATLFAAIADCRCMCSSPAHSRSSREERLPIPVQNSRTISRDGKSIHFLDSPFPIRIAAAV